MSKGARVYRFDDLSIDRTHRRVQRRGQAIELPALSFRALEALVEAAPGPLSADQLIQRAWNGAGVTDETVTQRIRLLRQALGDNSQQPRYIEALPSAGYRLVPLVVEDAEPPPRNIGALAISVGMAALVLTVAGSLVVWWLTEGRVIAERTGLTRTVPDSPVRVDAPTGREGHDVGSAAQPQQPRQRDPAR